MPNEETEIVHQTDPLDGGAAEIIAERDASREAETVHEDEPEETDEFDGDDGEGDNPEDGEESEDDESEGDEENEQDETDESGGEKASDQSDVWGSVRSMLSKSGDETLIQRFDAELEHVSGVVQSVAVVYEDPERAKSDVPEFLIALSRHHGIDMAELLGDELIASIHEPTFASPMEKTLHDRLKALEAREAADAKRKTQEQSDARLREFVKSEAPKIQSALKKRYDGYVATPEQIEEAIRAFPSLSPAAAVEAKCMRQIVKHMTRRASQTRAKNIPEMDRSRDVGGVQVPDDPLEFSAAHAYAMRK